MDDIRNAISKLKNSVTNDKIATANAIMSLLKSVSPEVMRQLVQDKSWLLEHVPERFKTREMCIAAVKDNLWMIGHVPDHLRTQEMYSVAVEKDPCTLAYVPLRFMTPEMETFMLN